MVGAGLTYKLSIYAYRWLILNKNKRNVLSGFDYRMTNIEAKLILNVNKEEDIHRRYIKLL